MTEDEMFAGWLWLASFIVTVLVIKFAGWPLYERLNNEWVAAIITAALILVAGIAMTSVVL
jgi:hypothetical protein